MPEDPKGLCSFEIISLVEGKRSGLLTMKFVEVILCIKTTQLHLPKF